MPNVPYTSEEFIQVLNDNAALQGSYAEGIESLNNASEIIKNTASDIMQDVVTDINGQFNELIDTLTERLSGGIIIPSVANQGDIVPTGSYATATYYNLEFGVKIAYDTSGDVYIVMKGGTTTSYEYLHFTADSVPEGVTVEDSVNVSSSSYVTAAPGMLQVGIIHGITGRVNISLTMSTYNATYDYTDVKVTVTPV